MTTPLRRKGGRVYYERGAAIEFAYPTFDAPESRLTFMRNPLYGTAHEEESLPQGMVTTPTGRNLASSIASAPVRFLPYSWRNMPEGWPQAQRIAGTVTLHADSVVDATMAGADLLVSIGFKSFDGATPAALSLQQLNAVGTVLVTTTFPLTTSDRVVYPQGGLRRLDLELTAHASTHQLRILAQSSGQDFLVTDVHAMHGDDDAFEDVDFLFDSDADGVGDAWGVDAGSAASCSHYAEDAAGLREWIREIADGALKTFEVRRPGIGNISLVRLIAPIQQVGFALETGTSVGGVDVRLEELP